MRPERRQSGWRWRLRDRRIKFGVVPAMKGEDDLQTLLRSQQLVPFRIGGVRFFEASEYAERFLHTCILRLKRHNDGPEFRYQKFAGGARGRTFLQGAAHRGSTRHR